MHIHHPLNELIKALDHGGLRAGLVFLNQRVPHRFTAVYKLENDVFRLQELVDKLDEPVSEMLQAVPFDDSFCQFAVALSEFVSINTAADSRLDGHKYQGVVGSYVGLPLTVMPTGLYGTFCHYDLVPQSISDDEFEYLQRATRVLPKYFHRRSVTNVQPL